MEDTYYYEVETRDGTIFTETDKFDKGKVARISFIPKVPTLPRHDIITGNGVSLIRRFTRVFINGFNGMVKERLHCAETNKYRMYIKSSTGQCLITPRNYELYL